ncbi:MAG: thermonuclease family protein [Candidatus Paceibacterota bacterium]|jgi:micrococcal nuclease
MIEYIFFFIFFLSIIGLIAGLIKPSLVKIKSRKMISLIFTGLAFASLIIIGFTAPAASNEQSNGKQINQQTEAISETSESTQNQEQPVKSNENTNSQQTAQVASNNDSKVIESLPEATGSKAILYSVVKVVDGDTIDVSINGETKRLRLIGINTPETVDPRTPVECFGKEASDKAKSLLTGKKVSLEADSTQGELDKYSRLLRYVFLEDGTNFNLYMIKEGYAYEYTYNTAYKYQKEFKESQVYAKTNNKGLWSPTTCNGELKSAEPQATNTSSSTSSFGSCGTKTTCSQMTTCEEARYFLNTCGVTRLDGDSDGVPCQTTVCKN